MQDVDFDVLCVGGEKEATGLAAVNGSGARIIQVDLDDDGLALAYSGAAALVYPSLYEGFGLPVAEAMSCGSPVICTSRGSLAEVAAEAAIQISGTSTQEMVAALQQVRDLEIRQRLVKHGAVQATRFRWEPFADEMVKLIHSLAAENERGLHRDFYQRWTHLRKLQGEVDTLV
jgi:glycosyltransferase involved in cell wall biosynthesis